MNRKTLWTIVQLIIFVALGGGIVWYMFAQMTGEQRHEMFAAIRQTRLWVLVPVFIACLISHWARARRWMLMLDPLAIHPTTANTLFSVLIGYIVNLIPPRAGEVAKCTVLARYERVPTDKMIGTIVAERAWDVLCLLIVIGIGLVWQADAVGEYLQNELRGRAPDGRKILMWTGILAALIAAMVFIYRRNRQSRVGRFIKGLGEGVGSIFKLKKRGLFLLYTLLIWSMYLMQVQLGFWSIPSTQHLGLGPSLMVLIFGSLAMIAAPGGVGLYPYMVARMLTKGYSLSVPVANAFGWVSWMAQTGIILILGIASLILLPFYNRKQHDAQAPVDTE